MKVCGIELKGSEAIVVSLEGTKGEFTRLAPTTKKIALSDNKTQESAQSFLQTIQQYLRDAGIEAVGIKERATTGEFGGGAMTFKLEGLIQSLDLPVQLFHPSTLAATMRRTPVSIEDQKLHKYQTDAFKVAYHLLGE
ncbi:DUF3010 family protein [Tumebacillus sp. ITR2]|uniref:DUF3010 family protein n=1 Tax=Tumebacillus amylolyticus TaxID=2801339 RepID=A0ABS1JBC6_9BACL|nr:DUF3010 family protein [Tumebacillus amylolyticus]MBL0387572.1 DUF3010 family protein [Tumebacillus amylolyticus]